jgi:hypothetical protein
MAFLVSVAPAITLPLKFSQASSISPGVQSQINVKLETMISHTSISMCDLKAHKVASEGNCIVTLVLMEVEAST